MKTLSYEKWAKELSKKDIDNDDMEVVHHTDEQADEKLKELEF